MSWNLLARFLESEHFNRDPALTVAYLARYADHVGIHYVLCSKLRQFSYEEIEFFLPQLCHLVISLHNDSMALEEFLVDLCEESVNGALLTFWILQTYLHDLAADPTSNAFQTCRRIYNKVQSVVFGGREPTRRDRIQENILPVTVLSSLVLASIGLPLLQQYAGPLATAQARRPRPIEDATSETLPPTQKLPRRTTVVGSTSSLDEPRPELSNSKGVTSRSARKPHLIATNDGATSPPTQHTNPGTGETRTASHRHTPVSIMTPQGLPSSISLPDQQRAPRVVDASGLAASVPSSPGVPRRPNELSRRRSHVQRVATPSSMSRAQKARMLRQNYFRNETQFLTALEGISARLVLVPKAARLSALRAELALVAQDLPAEVDIPLICPPTLFDGTASRSRHHRIVRLNPAEATSLNSAERVPYLLMLEVVRDDFDFDPESEDNLQLLAVLLSEKSKSRRRLFDTSDAAREVSLQTPQAEITGDSVLEPATGDLSSAALLQDVDGDISVKLESPGLRALKELPRLSSGVSTLSSNASLPTPRTSEGPVSRSSSPGRRPSPYLKAQNPNQADVSALADHMRTASQMLAQLELSASKRPKTEVAAIKAKIIASMQSLEEQSFLSDDVVQSAPSFETIMARASADDSRAEPAGLVREELDTSVEPHINPGKGAARMENDAMTGGIQRKADRDDPSAATFGEAWEEKKERIRRSSPYGWVPNWDLVSVIVKTGADLRQEAFACQLIAVCAKIFAEHAVDVWVKKMRILVTGESAGLIETITNAVSLHSLKRSLTLASITAGTNPRKRIATLQDHFIKTFGKVDTPAHAAATDCFARSLAAYSIVSYILQLKDRHNGNILIDSHGHCVHIDFGFMLSNSPGNMGFEAAPFKLTLDDVELLGGLEGAAFLGFKDLMKDAFQALRREAERIVTLVELMGREGRMPCYGGGVVNVVAQLRSRFVLEKSKEEAREWVEELVAKSVGSYYTRLYDTYQYRTQGIY